MKYSKLLLVLFVLVTAVSCKKSFLEKEPLDQIVNSNFYQTPEQLLQATAPLYNAVWLSYNFKAIRMFEQRGGTLFENGNAYKNFSVPSTNDELSEAWQAFYNTIGHANITIQNINLFTPASVSEAARNNAIAEARFMRGLAYSYMVQIWKDIPVIENNFTLLTDTSKRRNTYESVWNFIIKDMRFAADNLYATAPQTGRLSKWAGKAMLARMYLTRAGVGSTNGTRKQADLDSAAILSRDVIANGPYKMLDNYEDLFKMVNNNNSESVVALQWVYNGGWGLQNATQSFLAFSSNITGFADGWGAASGAGYNTLKMYESLAVDKRRKATYMLPGDTYSYITAKVGNNSGPLVVPMTANFTDAATSNFAWIKKYIVGRPEDNNGKVISMGTEINTYMMRFSEVYLILAEAILGNNASTSDAEAVNAVNKIRNRAGLGSKEAVTWDDIYKERMLEFAMENMSAFDFARLHYYDPAKAYQMLSAMYRGYYSITPIPNKTNPTNWIIDMRWSQESEKYATVNETNFYLPIPDKELTKAPALKLPPVPYE